MPNQGDILLIPIPFTDLTSQKRRPVVVISNDDYNHKTADVVVVAMTSNPDTLTVWFGNPQDEYVCEETGDEVILMKDKSGQVIGFEKLNYLVSQPSHLQVAFETVAA